ncbi:MAG: hypothetical protein ACOX4G_12885 [Limnochordia bacterium]
MYATKTNNRRSAAFLLISTLLHTLIVFLVPGFGLQPANATLALGNSVEVTIIPLQNVALKKAPAPRPEPVKKPAPVKKVEAPSQPKPVALPPAPVTVPRQNTGKAATDRILTETSSPQQVPEVSTAKPAVQEPANKPEIEAREVQEKEPEPPAPPLVGDVVSGHGLLRHYPAKEAALLAAELRARVEVTVTTEGRAVNPKLLTPSGHSQLDLWVTQTAARQLTFAPASSPYQVTIEVLVHPETKRVTLSPLGDRVRFVQP